MANDPRLTAEGNRNKEEQDKLQAEMLRLAALEQARKTSGKK